MLLQATLGRRRRGAGEGSLQLSGSSESESGRFGVIWHRHVPPRGPIMIARSGPAEGRARQIASEGRAEIQGEPLSPAN